MEMLPEALIDIIVTTDVKGRSWFSLFIQNRSVNQKVMDKLADLSEKFFSESLFSATGLLHTIMVRRK